MQASFLIAPLLALSGAGRPDTAAIGTVGHATLNTVVERFIAHIRDFTRPMRPRTRTVG
jgi:hypothetical protein